MLKKYDNICETIKTKPLKGIFFFILLFFFLIQHVVAQPILNKSDIVVVGVNTDNKNNNCEIKSNYNYDNIYLVNLEDIKNGYTFSITDNRYDKAKDMLLNNEGIYTFERVGGNINKGTIFKLDITSGSINVDDIINGWKLVKRYKTFGLNGDGDQFFVIEGKSWSIGSKTNKDYILLNNDNIITAYNSLNNWSNIQNNNNSNLPSSTNVLRDITKHHFTPKNENKKYRFYNGKINPTSKNEWLIRLLNPDNWLSFDDCNQFVTQANKVEFKNFTIVDNITKEACINLPFALEIDYETFTSTNSIQTNYQWYKVSTPTNTGGTFIGNGRQLNFIESTAGTYYYYCKITYQLKWCTNSNTNCTSATSTNVVNSGYIKVKVNPLPKTSPIKEDIQ